MSDKWKIEIIEISYGAIVSRTYPRKCFEPNEVRGHMANIAMDQLLYSMEKAAEIKKECGQSIPYEDLPSIHFDPIGIIVRRNRHRYFEYRVREVSD